MKLREDAAWLQGRSAARKALRKAYKKREGPEPHPQDWTGGASLGSALRGQGHVLSEGVSEGQGRDLPLVWRAGVEQAHSYPLRETGLGTYLGLPLSCPPHLGLSPKRSPNQILVGLVMRSSWAGRSWCIDVWGYVGPGLSDILGTGKARVT